MAFIEPMHRNKLMLILMWVWMLLIWDCSHISQGPMSSGGPLSIGDHWKAKPPKYLRVNSLRLNDTYNHICISKLTIIGSDNGLSPGRHQAIIWTTPEILLIGPSGTNFREIVIEIHTFSFKKMHLKMLSGKWWPFCLGLNVLRTINSCDLTGWQVSLRDVLRVDQGTSWSKTGSTLRHEEAHVMGSLISTWINLIHSMDKSSHAQSSVGWNYLSIPKLQRFNRWSLGMYK